MNNIIIVGAILVIAAIVITVLSFKLHRKKKQISLVETGDTDKSETQQAQDEVIKQTSEMIKDLPPVNGPDMYKVDFDNPYTITNNEPLVIAEKSEIEDFCEKAGNGEINTTPLVIPEMDMPTPVMPKLESFNDIVAETVQPVKKRGRKKKETPKTEKKSEKKPEKKTIKKTENSTKSVKTTTKKTTKKTKKEVK